MGSPTSRTTQPDIARPVPRENRPVPGVSARHRAYAPGWPGAPLPRAAIRLAFAAPYVAVAVLAHRGGYDDSVNHALVAQARLVRWGSSDLTFVRHVYPPLPTLIASVLPNALALAVIGALCAGVILETACAGLGRAGYPGWAAVGLVAAFGATPSFALTATTDLLAFLTLALLALALDMLIRFAVRGSTYAGFSAGLVIALAVLCDPVAIVFAAAMAISAPLIARRRYRGQDAAGLATFVVLMFPTAAVVAGWTFLCWRFGHDPWVWLRTAAPRMWEPTGALHRLSTVLHPLWTTPVFMLAVIIRLARREIGMVAGVLVPCAAILVALSAGLTFPPSSVAVTLGVLGLRALPGRPRPRLLGLIVLVAVGGLVATWLAPPIAGVDAWLAALRR